MKTMAKEISLTLQDIFSQIDFLIIIRIILTIILAAIIYKILSRIINRAAKGIKIQPEIVKEIINFLRIVIGSLSFISILGFLGIDVTGLIAGVGIGALAVGFAAQTLISNLISGLFLIFERTFVAGDIIKISDTSGKVIHIGFRATQIQTVDGNVVVIPNSTLASSQIVNLTSRKDEMTLTIEENIDMYSDVERAKQLLLEAVSETKGTIIDDEHTPLIIVERRSSEWRIVLRIIVAVEASDWYIIRSNIMEVIKRKFDQEGILPPIPAFAREQVARIKQELSALQGKS